MCRSRSGNGISELIVVTIIVAAEGGVKVPKVSSREELKTALNKLGSLRSEQVCHRAAWDENLQAMTFSMSGISWCCCHSTIPGVIQRHVVVIRTDCLSACKEVFLLEPESCQRLYMLCADFGSRGDVDTTG